MFNLCLTDYNFCFIFLIKLNNYWPNANKGLGLQVNRNTQSKNPNFSALRRTFANDRLLNLVKENGVRFYLLLLKIIKGNFTKYETV